MHNDDRWMAACRITLSEVIRGQEGVSEAPLAYCSQERLRQRSPDAGVPSQRSLARRSFRWDVAIASAPGVLTSTAHNFIWEIIQHKKSHDKQILLFLFSLSQVMMSDTRRDAYRLRCQ